MITYTFSHVLEPIFVLHADLSECNVRRVQTCLKKIKLCLIFKNYEERELLKGMRTSQENARLEYGKVFGEKPARSVHNMHKEFSM
jgi:hypothetical protein